MIPQWWYQYEIVVVCVWSVHPHPHYLGQLIHHLFSASRVFTVVPCTVLFRSILMLPYMASPSDFYNVIYRGVVLKYIVYFVPRHTYNMLYILHYLSYKVSYIVYSTLSCTRYCVYRISCIVYLGSWMIEYLARRVSFMLCLEPCIWVLRNMLVWHESTRFHRLFHTMVGAPCSRDEYYSPYNASVQC